MKDTIKDNTRETIVKAARQIFSQYGFFKATMDDIGKAIGKGKSSLYYYFTSKEEILQAVIDSEVNLIRKELEEILSDSENQYQKIQRYLNFRMEKMSFLISFYGKSEREYLEHFAFTEDFREIYEHEERQLIARLLKEGVDSGEFNEMDINLTATTISISLKGFEYPWILKGGGDEIREKLNDFLNILFYGIAKR